MTVPIQQVKQHINDAIDVAVTRVEERSEEFFRSEIASTGNGTASPFQKLLFPEGRVFSSFERSLSASLGKAWDYIGAAIARETYGNGQHDYSFSGSITRDTLSEIESVVSQYKQRLGITPDTIQEIQRIDQALSSGGEQLRRTVKNDVYFVDHDGYENYIEIKTSLPNYDQLAAMKTRILTIHSLRRGSGRNWRALAAFPHNPNGLIGVYAWPPLRYFLDPDYDWRARDYALMGPGLWNFIGDSPDTYEDLLECFYAVSNERRSDLFQLLNIAEAT